MDEIATSTSNPTPNPNTDSCPRCGAVIDPRVDQCPSCLASIADAPPVTERPTSVPFPEPSDENHAICTICRNQFAKDEMIAFGDRWVCAGCKGHYIQLVAQGMLHPDGVRYGGFWIRFAAKFIDGIIMIVASMALFALITPLYSSKGPVTVILATIGQFLAQVAIGTAYATFFVGAYRATPGKMACGLVVVTPGGGRVSYLRAFARHFAEMVSGLILYIGYLLAAFDDEKRALHDRMCATRVVYK